MNDALPPFPDTLGPIPGVNGVPSSREVADALIARGLDIGDARRFNYFPGPKARDAEAIADSIQAAMNEIAAFNALPEETQLRHYLAEAYLALNQIAETCQMHVDDIVNKRFDIANDKRLEAFSIAERAAMLIPSNLTKDPLKEQ